MSTTGPIGSEGIDGVLRDLAPRHLIAVAGDARLVTGSAGAFVLLPAGDAPDGAAERCGRLAETTRAALAQHMGWVPFVDAVVVVRPGETTGVAATAVPLDLLGEVLVEGPPVIEGSTLDQIAQLVRDGALVTWRTATTGDDGKIDLCERVPQIVGTPASVPVAPPLDGVGSGPDVAPA